MQREGWLPRLWGACAGLRQAMATAGALVGASIAGLAYKLSGQNYTLTFAMATIPACLALLLTISVRAGPAGTACATSAACVQAPLLPGGLTRMRARS